MVEQSHQEYIRAIELAQQEKNQLIQKLKGMQKLQQRLTQLDMFIEQGRLLLGIDPPEISESAPPISAEEGRGLFNLDDSEKPIYLKVSEILKESGKPMSLSGIVEEFRKRNWKLSKKNPREVLRNALKLKSQIFLKSEQERGKGKRALFTLKEGSLDQ